MMIKFLYILTIINTITSRTCGDFIPSNKNECFEFSNTMEYCCYITDDLGQSEGCGKIAVAEFPTFRGSKYYNYGKYNYDCGETYNKNESISCGTNPASELDCYRNSTVDNSCCYYNYGGYKGCLNYGNKIQGSMPFGLFILKCSSDFISYSFAFILLVFLI